MTVTSWQQFLHLVKLLLRKKTRIEKKPMSAYTADGKRRSSQTHARRNHLCELCGVYSTGNGGKVAHARSHVRAGEAVELVKWHPMMPSPTRVFLPAGEVDRIVAFVADGFVVHGEELS